MINACKADIVQFVAGTVLSLEPYAKAQAIGLQLMVPDGKVEVTYYPQLLSQSLMQLLCNMLDLLPAGSNVRVTIYAGKGRIAIIVENDTVNLVRLREVNAHKGYSFSVSSLSAGTRYRLVLPLQEVEVASRPVRDGDRNDRGPHFHAEIRKRLNGHFTTWAAVLTRAQPGRMQDAVFLEKVNAVIQAHFSEEAFGTNELCRAMALSRTQLFRRLKPLIREAPAHYIQAMRLHYARELLEVGDLAVSEVAYRAGFQSHSHFSRLFQKRYGMQPSFFRRCAVHATNRTVNAINRLQKQDLRG